MDLRETVGVILAAACWVGHVEAAWVVHEIPNPPGWAGDTDVYSINEQGVICGTGSYVSEVSSVAFRYDGVTLTELPYLDPSPATYPFAWASAINAHGVIAGRSHDARGVDRAVIWDGNTATAIPYPADANTDNDMRAYGMNDAGVVVGYYSSTTTGYQAAFYYDGTTTHSLASALQAAGLTGERSYAEDINNSGLICGHAEDPTSEYLFFTYDIHTGTVTVLGGMSPFGGTSYFTAAINEAGHVVGRGRELPWDPTIHALLHDGTFRIIDDSVTVAQWARGISNRGRIVGYADTSANQWGWYADGAGTGRIIPVTFPGWTRVAVRGVNDEDVIVGSGRTATSGSDNVGFIAAPLGDADRDRDVDLADFAAFQTCLGQAVVALDDCWIFDADSDHVVALDDYLAVEAVFTGPGS